MEWYYVDGGQQAGPVSDAELDRLVKAGKVFPTTLVWNAGMAAWQPYGEVQKKTIPPSIGAAAACAECGREFPHDDMIHYENSWVCAACKPIFFQRLKEGGKTATALDYASFGVRFGAKIFDGLIVTVGTVLVAILVAWLVFGKIKWDLDTIPTLIRVFQFGNLIIFAVYDIFFLGKYGATPGKMVCNIKVVTPEGEPITYARACGRHFAEIISGMVCYIGYIMAGFDEEKRALHDRICNTRVVKK